MTPTNTAGTRNASTEAPEASRTDADGWNRRGLDSFRRGDLRQALGDFREASRQAPDFATAWNNSGLVLQTVGRHAEAVADFGRALAARPDYPEALANRARSRQAQGDLVGALADFDRALACAPAAFAASVLHNRAALRQAQGDLAGALADFDRALERDPGHVVTHVNRGAARKESGDLAGALADFDRALAALPPGQQAPVFHLRGGVRALQNDFAAALADYDRAIALDPSHYLFHVSRGHARYHGRDPRGVADYLRAFRLDAEGTAREMVRFLAEDARRDADGVLENCAKHLRINARDVLARARRGATLVLLGRDEEALLDFSHFMDQAPEAWGDFCRLVDQARRYRAALAGRPLGFQGVRAGSAGGVSPAVP